MRCRSTPSICFFIGLVTPCGTPVTRIAPHVTTLVSRRGFYGFDVLSPPVQDVDSLHFSVHVRDLSHPDRPPVEIPAVRQRDLRSGRVVLPGIPTSSRYRSNLRLLSSSYQVTRRCAHERVDVVIDTVYYDRYWALLTLTDNETQQVTTFMP